ncbi:DUF4259 domain-containing protein [Streptomyces bauhiniae]|uniref:DUF4259 domain-containing protein n=1 Tax=Streptomyces bauhiniae TaxID=2340725 RepID=UPI0035E2C7F9
MGTWDVDPSDNDTAADFCSALDKAAAAERKGIIRGALTRVIDIVDYLEAPKSERLWPPAPSWRRSSPVVILLISSMGPKSAFRTSPACEPSELMQL